MAATGSRAPLQPPTSVDMTTTSRLVTPIARGSFAAADLHARLRRWSPPSDLFALLFFAFHSSGHRRLLLRLRCTPADRPLPLLVLTREWDKVGGAKRFRPCPTTDPPPGRTC